MIGAGGSANLLHLCFMRTGERMEIRCRKCGTIFEGLVDDEDLCPICRRFGGRAGSVPEIESPQEGAQETANPCAMHPGNPSRDVCSRCGNFMCSLCVIRVGRKKVCPECFNLLYGQDKVFTRLASFGERLGGLLLDITLFFFIYITVSMIVFASLSSRSDGEAYQVAAFLLFLGLWSFYNVGMWSFAGATLGKKAAGIKIVGPDRKPPSLLRALARYGMYWISAAPFFLGFLWAGWERKSRTWHDMVAGTEVIKVRKKAS